jgi:GAF domain-containing protein
MKRRSKPSRKPVKARPRRASKPKSRNAPKALSRSGSTPAAQETEVARLTRELKEAREQQIATSEVLKVISRSEFDLRAVLENLVEKAVRVCGAERGTIWRQDGDLYRVAASYGHSIEYLERVTARYPIQPDRSSAVGRAILERHSIHIHDTLADPEYGWGKDHHGDKEMHRTMLAVPMLREDAIIGVIAISPIQVKPFTDEQIALVQNFAAQAVIAIENARLLSELRERTADLSQRTADLTESLEQQTATSEVLKVISRSAFDLKVVLDTLLRSAGSLCEADLGVIARLQDGKFYRTVSYGLPDNLTGQVQNEPVELNRSSVSGRALHEGRVVQIADIETDAEYTHPARETGAFRTLIGVPIMREGLPVGVMTLGRRTVQPFTNKQIELVTTFADQAGIAIENARLLNELRDSLEEQTATAEVLQVISSSPGDLKPVFAAMLEKAARICDAAFGNIYRWDGDAMHLVGTHNTPAALAKARGRSPIRSMRERLSVICWLPKRQYTSRTLLRRRSILKNATQ